MMPTADKVNWRRREGRSNRSSSSNMPARNQGGRSDGGRGRGSGRSQGRGRSDGRGTSGTYGRGRSQGRGGGRSSSPGGRGGGGRGGGRGGSYEKPFPQARDVLSNLLPCQLSPGFKFYQYSVDCADKRGKLIDSRLRRFQLFNFGLFDPKAGLVRRKTNLNERQIKELKKVIFFQGSYVLSARPIPGLELDLEDFKPDANGNTKGVALVGGGDGSPSSDEGDIVTVVQVQGLCAPIEMMEDVRGKEDEIGQLTAAMGDITVDLRIVNEDCTMSFDSREAMMNHCRDTGHFPVASIDGEKLKPANKEEFLQFANVVLRRALSDRMPKWGREFIDPKSFTEPADKFGKPLGVRVYRAFSCEFGWNKSKPLPSEPIKLVLTTDLRAKIMRTKSLLDVLCEGRSQMGSPELVKFDAQAQKVLKKQWIGEVVIATYDKRCYSVIDLLFDKSPANHMVQDLNISHAEYFKKRKNIDLKFPKARPMVAVGGRNDSVIYLPAELVTGNELDAQIKMKLPTIASFRPDDRLKGIEEIKRFLRPGSQKSKGSGLLPALGFSLEEKLIKVRATRLALPEITVAGIKVPEKSGGMWAPLMSKANYKANPKHAVQMKVILVQNKTLRDTSKVYNRIRDMVNGQNSKYRLGDKPHEVISVGTGREHYGAVEKHFGPGSKLPNNVFVLDFCRPQRGASTDPAYSVVKCMLGKGGFISQFVNWGTYDHSNPRDPKRSTIILSGVARQILSKCGVRIWFVSIPRTVPMPAVFVGVDVFHAPRKYDPVSGKRKAKESVAAVIVQIMRSHSPDQNTDVELYCETESRMAGKEIELGALLNRTVSNALKAFKLPNPASCFVWRDGVGDSTISQVAEQEIPQVRSALASGVVGAPQAKKGVALSYTVCQKRINTKFLTDDGTKIPAGVFVSGLQMADYKTYYINGTSPPYSTPKPCRFIEVERDTALNKVSSSNLAWALCHDYANWAGPIKLPSVVQMAHKLAELTGGMQDNGNSINYQKYAGKIFFL